jgi:hypothetical protein
VPVAQRRLALRGQATAWSPFDESACVAAISGTHATLLAWDARAVREALTEAGAADDATVLPEPLLRAPLEAGGERVIAGKEGYEGQVWRAGNLQASRWWSALPSDNEWAAFARQEHLQGARPELSSVDWLMRPWIDAQDPQDVGGQWSRLESLAVGATALCLLGMTSAQLSTSWRLHKQSQSLASEIERVSSVGKPIVAARDRALSRLSEIEVLNRGMQSVQPIELLRHLSEVLPGKGVTLREVELTGAAVRLALELSPEVQRSGIVRDLQAGGWITEVTELRDASNRGLATFEMKLNSLRVPVATAKALVTGTAPSAAGTTTGKLP